MKSVLFKFNRKEDLFINAQMIFHIFNVQTAKFYSNKIKFDSSFIKITNKHVMLS